MNGSKHSCDVSETEFRSGMTFLKIILFTYGVIYGLISWSVGLVFFLPCCALDILYGVYLCIRKKPDIKISIAVFSAYIIPFIIYIVNGEIGRWFDYEPITSLGGFVWLFSCITECMELWGGAFIWGAGLTVQVIMFVMSAKICSAKKK